MPRLLIQADDNGITIGVVEGIRRAIEAGTVRSTGLFTNRPWARIAAEQLRDNNNVSLGLDLNLVTGRPLSDVAEVPGLVDRQGNFITSSQRIADNVIVSADDFIFTFEHDPFVVDQVRHELNAQVKQFRRTVGRDPDYLHFHSLCTPNVALVAEELSRKIGAPLSTATLRLSGVRQLPNTWYKRPFPLDEQAAADPYTAICEALDSLGEDETGVLICHPGLVDSELLDLSSFSIVRARDLAALTSPQLRDRLTELDIQLVNYAELYASS